MLDKLVVVSTLVKSDDINPRASDSCPTDSTRHVYQSIFGLILNYTYSVTTIYTLEPARARVGNIPGHAIIIINSDKPRQ